jgi:hypothetical protein
MTKNNRGIKMKGKQEQRMSCSECGPIAAATITTQQQQQQQNEKEHKGNSGSSMASQWSWQLYRYSWPFFDEFKSEAPTQPLIDGDGIHWS